MQELTANLESELMPFFVASKNVINDVTSALSKGMGSTNLMRFVEENKSELKDFFPLYMQNYENQKKSIKIDNSSSTPEKNVEFPRFIENGDDLNNNTNKTNDNTTVNDTIFNETNKIELNLGQELDKYIDETQNVKNKQNIEKNPEKIENSQQNTQDLSKNTNIAENSEKNSVLSPEICEDLMKKYPFIDFGCKASSFLQTRAYLRFL